MDLIYYYLPALETVRDFLEMGGGVLYIIGVLLMFMWALIIERLVYLRFCHKRLIATTQQLWEARSALFHRFPHRSNAIYLLSRPVSL